MLFYISPVNHAGIVIFDIVAFSAKKGVQRAFGGFFVVTRLTFQGKNTYCRRCRLLFDFSTTVDSILNQIPNRFAGEQQSIHSRPPYWPPYI